MIIWLIFVLFLQTKPSFCRLFACPSWTFLPNYRLSEYTRCGDGGGWVRMETGIVSVLCIGRNCLLGNGKKIAKFLMRTFACRSTFLYGCCCWGIVSIRLERIIYQPLLFPMPVFRPVGQPPPLRLFHFCFKNM